MNTIEFDIDMEACGGIDKVILHDEMSERDDLAFVPEHTCKDVGERCDFACSDCGARLYTETSDGYTIILGDETTIIIKPRFCPYCGAKVVY